MPDMPCTQGRHRTIVELSCHSNHPACRKASPCRRGDVLSRAWPRAALLPAWACGREHYSIHPDDPLSARAECHWTEERARGDWKVRTETWSAMTASKTHFHVTGKLEAYEGEQKILTRTWDKKIKRQLV